ncbi:hypothetical protein PRK78_004591 [Emydomyces testavorans]|uniref:Uncharacterized protein n=1 Tax=Emydomyces testavorans TaxID=2070801 RepID=A0AAF0DK65_9EURO|nr:hypothetical protein PRK78_004591 [Emydomyces testavorans]
MPLLPRRQQSESDLEPEPKRHKIDESARESRSQRPVEFWDNLSKIWLTKKALQELDRRNTELSRCPFDTHLFRPVTGQCYAQLKRKQITQYAADFLSSCSPDCLKQIKQFSRHGGPDLSDLRSFPENKGHFEMPKRPSADAGSSYNTQTKRTSRGSGSYSRCFEQHLIDHGVYPAGYRYPDGQRPEKPRNWKEINLMLTRSRASLSPSEFNDEIYEEFREGDMNATSETITTDVIPFIEGKISNRRTLAGGIPFGNLQPLTDHSIPEAKPDRFYGAQPEQLSRAIRDDLGKLIIPSTQDSRPMLPNFFFEAKSSDGSAAVGKRQACYYGALGSRAMQSLQSYGRHPVYDCNAYTITATYYDGTLKLYTVHATAPRAKDDRPEYIMTQLNTWGMTGNIETFRQGASAYRNACDWAKEQRDSFIKDANNRFEETQIRRSTVELETTSELTAPSDNSDTAVPEEVEFHGVAQ